MIENEGKSLRLQFQIVAGTAGDAPEVIAANQYLSEQADCIKDSIAEAIKRMQAWQEEKAKLELYNKTRSSYDRYSSQLQKMESLNKRRPNTIKLSNEGLQKCSDEQIEKMHGYHKLHEACSSPEIDMKVTLEKGRVVIHLEEGYDHGTELTKPMLVLPKPTNRPDTHH